ncbi:hypothetical protein EIB71_02405 [Kaistella daneshvariae]|uniref:Band 7 domain-containing protein n=1 Tax=Kaistella daneshvariae TaxID=2487074 RepID=A0ABM7C6L2_9FLAO|nr:SPFH domain-containing protein [Kaistella daneshvariae]AZI66602.1 hypothetical protein EIB71_02405 [Kaistella daneshvariae]
MSLTTLLLLLIGVITFIGVLTKKLDILTYGPPDKNGKQTPNGFKWKPATFIFLACLAAMVQPMNYEVISVGHKGLLINLLGDKRGVSYTEEVSGVVFYNKYTQEIQEIPLDQRHIEYPESIIVAKGGFPCPIKPSFNYSVKESTAADMFTNLRSTYKKGGLEAIQEGWLNNAIIGAINDVANRHSIDYLFNNRETYEAEILSEVNKRIGKWFLVSQLKTNIQPPKAIRQSIEDKATADADAIKAEAQARVAQADAQRKIQLAKGDSASIVIRAQADAKAISLKQQEITPTYVEYQRVLKWDGVMPATMLGDGSGTLLNVGK